MTYKVIFKVEHENDNDLVLADPSLYGVCKSTTDYAFTWPQVNPEQYVLGQMGADMVEWLNTNPALGGSNRLGFDQTRTDDLAFTRSLWVEFDQRDDALLFKLSWDRII